MLGSGQDFLLDEPAHGCFTDIQDFGRLFQRDLDMIKGAFRATGLPITDDPDDAFFLGRTFATVPATA